MALQRHQQQHSQRGQSSSRSDNGLDLDPAAANMDAQELYHTAFRILALLARVKLEQDTQAIASFLQESFDWIGLVSPPLHMTCLEPLFTGPRAAEMRSDTESILMAAQIVAAMTSGFLLVSLLTTNNQFSHGTAEQETRKSQLHCASSGARQRDPAARCMIDPRGLGCNFVFAIDMAR